MRFNSISVLKSLRYQVYLDDDDDNIDKSLSLSLSSDILSFNKNHKNTSFGAYRTTEYTR